MLLDISISENDSSSDRFYRLVGSVLTTGLYSSLEALPEPIYSRTANKLKHTRMLADGIGNFNRFANKIIADAWEKV